VNRRNVIFSAMFAKLTTHIRPAETASSQGKIWRVREDAEAGGDGASWSAAFQSLEQALAVAASGHEIWVARGVYHPDAADATKSFVLKPDVAVYGGFLGSEAERDQRDFASNPTILSGNIGKGDRTRNTHTIVMGADRAILDGFTIQDAYGTDEPRLHLEPADILKGDMLAGGGMRNFMTSPIVKNCIFKDNYSPKGGGVYNVHKPGADQATFVGVDFIDNVAAVRGGAVSNDLGAMPRFVNCRFIGNRCEGKGGGIYNDFAASPFVCNALFTRNQADTAGAIGNDGGSSPLLVNVTIENNKAGSGLGAGLYQGTGANNNPIIVNCVVDDIYNWHEDIVCEIGSIAPGKQTIPLKEFLPISNMNGQMQSCDVTTPPAHGVGYRPDLDGEILSKDSLVETLIRFHVQNGGAVEYHGEYTRPSANRQPVSARVIHVAPASSVPGGEDGLSWATALTDLQAAIELASVSKAAVWVKAGIYHPAMQEERIAAFTLYDGVEIYGGFTGAETAPTQRPSLGQRTILSAKTTSGAYRYPHVLYGADKVLLDKLTIRDGEATGFTYNGKGGGLLAYHAGKTFLPNGLQAYRAGGTLVSHSDRVGFTMTIQDCRFEQNSALEGGAIYAFGEARLTIVNTIFRDNNAIYGGAAVDREGGVSSYRNSAFIRNHAARDGGAFYADYGSRVTFEGVDFDGNQALEKGGAIFLISRASQLGPTAVSVKKSKFTGNEAPDGAGVRNLDGSILTVED
jgi:predicted outer membrane repeat protein